MNLAPSYAPTRFATCRRVVGQDAANPAGAGKWMPSPQHRGGACALRPVVCRRGISSALLSNAPAEVVVSAPAFTAGQHGCIVIRQDVLSCVVIVPAALALLEGVALELAVAASLEARSVWVAVANGSSGGHNGLGVDGFGESHIVLFAQGLGRVLIGEATENLGALESTNDNPMGAVVVEYCHRTADGLGFGAVCFHYPHTIASRLECVNRYFKKRFDFFGGWESGTYGRNTKGAEALS